MGLKFTKENTPEVFIKPIKTNGFLITEVRSKFYALNLLLTNARFMLQIRSVNRQIYMIFPFS